jgi:Tubulin like
MKLYQPMLFIGLGGTGCQVGVELERRLRDELCGPDGTDLQRSLQGINLIPFQLPSFLQFVYADLNEAELLRAKRMVVPTEEHLTAAGHTDHFVQKLVPRIRTYPEVSRSLRLNAPDETSRWLPPADGEPRVSPLVLGAGQLPTVGRAALFETFRGGLDNVLQPLDNAIGRISKSAGELTAMGGKLEQGVDVFVAFSVAGGTGAGIFYDFLHLVGNALARAGFKDQQIYPLVLMPSAFDEGYGGGRRAKLNAGHALLDLFRLVDDQNASGASTLLDGSRSGDRISVLYPGLGHISLPPATAQTAFLFSRTTGVEREDLHRSVVSFVLSLIGTSLAAESENVATDRTYQSFAEQFINQGVERQVTAYTGIGNRGVSTSLVASMTVPVDDLADVISSRLLARAVDEMSAPQPGRAEENRDYIDQFYATCGLDELRACEPEQFKEPVPARGAAAITQALQTRVRIMDTRLAALENRLRSHAPQLARNFDIRRGVTRGLAGLDVFRLQRVVAGHPRLHDPGDKLGFIGSLESRRTAPPVPTGLSAHPPAVESLRNRLGRKLQWGDPEVRKVIGQQDRWYRWRAMAAWHAAWGEQAPVWDRKVAHLRAELGGLVDAFVAHAREEPTSFAQRTADLYKPRTGVSYLLPPRGDLEQFYDAVVRRFVTRTDLGLRPTSTAAEIVTALLGPEGWQRSYELVIERGPEHGFDQAVLTARNLIKQEVKRLFIRRGEVGDIGDEAPLLPALRDLLAKAAGKDGPSIGDEDLAAFRRSIAGLVPAGFSPQGSGDLKILVAYPQAGSDTQIERYIEQQVNLPRDSAGIEFRATDTESIVVVLLRTSMSITEVPELRDILRQWADALYDGTPQDFLRWRQRLSYNFRWLATTENDRVSIMHRLLCAMWNGQITFIGSRESPQLINVRLPGDRPVSMELKLQPYGRASSWASILRSYEEWTLADGDQIRQDFCRRLMMVAPYDIQHEPRASELYEWFVDVLAPHEAETLRSAIGRAPISTRGWLEELRHFWTGTVVKAVQMPFPDLQNALYSNLDEARKDSIATRNDHAPSSGEDEVRFGAGGRDSRYGSGRSD